MENIIFVKNLSLFGIHGHDAMSKQEKREFIFDIEVTIDDISLASKTGKLSDTFDYKTILLEVESVFNSTPCILIETLADRIVQKITSHSKVQKIKLTLFKRELLHNAVSGITLIR